MGKILPFPGGQSKKSRKASRVKSTLSATINQVKEFAGLIKKKSLLKVAELQGFRSDFLLEITKEEKLKDLQTAFEQSSGKKISADSKYLAEFLVIRRYILAHVIVRASEQKPTNRGYQEGAAAIDEIIEALDSVATNNEWDWVRYNELEYELFLQLANLARDNKIKFILNRSRQTYLLSTMTLNAQYWNMEESVALYDQVWQNIRKKQGDQAKQVFLEFYEKNDKKIMHRYDDLDGI